MCKVLNIARSTYYDTIEKLDMILEEDPIVDAIVSVFYENRCIYGARKIKKALKKIDIFVSRRKIREIMKQKGLVSKYTVAQYKPTKRTTNDDKIENVVNRKFNDKKQLEVVVSDLTYVRVANKWHYICLLVDLFNREIIGHSVGPNKTAQLVYKPFANTNINLEDIEIFHTDRGSEFKNKIIKEVLETFDITRSLWLCCKKFFMV